MQDVIRLVVGDRKPSLEIQMRDLNGSPIDITGSSATFRIKSITTGVTTSSSAVITDGVSGRVRYDWQTQDTTTPGHFVAEFRIVHADGRQQTAPALTPILINVRAAT